MKASFQLVDVPTARLKLQLEPETSDEKCLCAVLAVQMKDQFFFYHPTYQTICPKQAEIIETEGRQFYARVEHEEVPYGIASGAALASEKIVDGYRQEILDLREKLNENKLLYEDMPAIIGKQRQAYEDLSKKCIPLEVFLGAVEKANMEGGNDSMFATKVITALIDVRRALRLPEPSDG